MANIVPQNLGTLIGTAGTTVLCDQSGNLAKVIFAGTYVGSIEIYDSATTTGTAAGNKIWNAGLPGVTQYSAISPDFPFKKGLTVVATGTPIMGFVWNK